MTTILGIETSCDETAASVVRADKTILSNIIHSQREHDIYGGVVPEIASREHIMHIIPVVELALKEAGIALQDVDAIAATAGPGLIGGVIVGLMTAKTLASAVSKPLIAVNHLEGHALSVRLSHDVAFPYLLLLVSGGHCQLLVVEGVGRYRLLGETLDDALGEAFDKTAKMLELGYPGGPAVEALAKQGDPSAFKLPIPLHGRAGCDFSFAGLKTAVRLAITPQMTQAEKANLCAAFQRAASASVAERLRHALALCSPLLTREGLLSINSPHAINTPHPNPLPQGEREYLTAVVVAGGVAANQAINAVLSDVCNEHGLALIAPPMKLCTDNAAMIAWAGLEHFALGHTSTLDVEPRARWPLYA